MQFCRLSLLHGMACWGRMSFSLKALGWGMFYILLVGLTKIWEGQIFDGLYEVVVFIYFTLVVSSADLTHYVKHQRNANSDALVKLRVLFDRCNVELSKYDYKSAQDMRVHASNDESHFTRITVEISREFEGIKNRLKANENHF